MVSKTKSNKIGGPGHVITQDELNYLRDVFRQAGTTNINQQSLILDKNVFYKFRIDMPYAQTGKFRGYLGKGVDILNSASRGTFSIELGGKDIELTDLDIGAVREHLLEEGKMLIKIGTLLRIRDEKYGDWVYMVTTNVFYPYDTLTRPFMEEFMPESIRFAHREAKMSSIIGPRDPKDKIAEDDYGASGEPVGDLLAIINNQLFQHERHRVRPRRMPVQLEGPHLPRQRRVRVPAARVLRQAPGCRFRRAGLGLEDSPRRRG